MFRPSSLIALLGTGCMWACASTWANKPDCVEWYVRTLDCSEEGAGCAEPSRRS